MFLFAITSAMAFCLVGFLVWRGARQRPWPLEARVAAVVGALWITSLATSWALQPRAADPEVATASGAALAWPVPTESPLVAEDALAPAAPSAGSPGSPVAPVESLVGGLEARLAANPNDAEGWGLLAQSYAFTANEEAVERAVRRAVELGVDEAALRERVNTAKRSAHSVDWVDRAVSGQGR